ncbi:MAG: hypothetical protein HY695_33720 [Deltaproteobacteria bacterium]|nr:hypothetical protein [Deltaproteobacteria bacterium]
MGEVPPLTELYQKYRPRDFEFLIVYVRESHPGENFAHHTSIEQKATHANKLKELENVQLRILVDDLQGRVHRAYGLLSNMVYLIDREGMVVYKSDWTNAAELDEMCGSLLRLDKMKKEGAPIIRKGVSQRLHWIPMDPALRERVYRRSGEKAIKDYFNVFGFLPYASDAEKRKNG